jgi:hypothetical protein
MKRLLVLSTLLIGARSTEAQDATAPAAPEVVPVPTAAPSPTPVPTLPPNRTAPLEAPIFPAPLLPEPAPETAVVAPPEPNIDPNGGISPAPTPVPRRGGETKGTAPVTPSGELPLEIPSRAIPEPPASNNDITGIEAPDGNFTLESPEGIIYDMEKGLALARSKVTFSYREFVGQADRGLVDYNTNTATLTGNLTVTARGQKFTGSTLVFNLDTGVWRLSQLQSTFPPEFFPAGTVIEPLYLRNGVVTGKNDEVSGQDFRFSSCDRDHYFLQSKKIEFVRDNEGEPSKIVLRKNGVYVLGARMLALPVYTISLVGQGARRQPLQATFGQNTTDGLFVKSFYTLKDDEIKTDSILLDALQNRGLGVGIQREFLSGGLLYLYALSGRTGGREINARIDKSYKFGQMYTLNARLDSTQNNSVGGEGSGTTSANFTFNRNGVRAKSKALLSFDRSEFSGNTSTSSFLTLNHNQNFGSGYSLDTDLRLSRSEYGTGINSRSETLDSTLRLTKNSKLFDVFLNTELHNDLVRNTTYQMERLPEITLQSATDRLKIPFVHDYLPGDFRISYGMFNEPNYGTDDRLGGRKSRFDMFYNARPKSWRLAGSGKSKVILSAAGNFEQAFYSDSSARYNYTYSSNLRGTWGNLIAQANYAKQRTNGFTPFQFDYYSPGETIDASLSYQVKDTLRFNLSSGRDIQNGVTRDLIARAQWSPNQDFYASLGTSYSPEVEEFGDIYGNLRFAFDRKNFLGGGYGFGFRYSPDGRGLTRANLSLDTQLGSKLRFQALAGYDGVNDRFDFTQYRLTQDLHCFNLYATYDSSQRELRFDIALKAFPFADTRFGRNETSEGFDSGVGEMQ